MTDGDGADIEPGTTLPVPPALDGHSTTSEGGDGTGDKSLDGNDEDIFASAESPLWAEGAEELPDDSNAKVGLPGEHDPCTFAQGMDSRDRDKDIRNHPLSEAESRALDSMVNQAMLSASLNDGLQLPWEVGVMASIFGDAPLASMPSIPALPTTWTTKGSSQARSLQIWENLSQNAKECSTPPSECMNGPSNSGMF